MKALWRGYIDASLILKITIALILGVIVGLLFGKEAAILAPFGDLLIRLLKFLIVPLILFTLIVGVNQTKMANLGRMGGKVFLYYLASSALAIIVGISVASIFDPGTGMTLDTSEKFEVPENPGVTSVILNIVPENIVAAFSNLNLLGIIFTAIAFGVAISALRSSKEHAELGENLYRVIDGLNEATLNIMKVIIQYVPIGIFAIIAEIVGNQGADTLLSLGNMIVVLYVALIVQVVFYIIFMILSKINVKRFFYPGSHTDDYRLCHTK